jgi:hypothetical protein
MYGAIHEFALSLSLAQCAGGFVAAAFASRMLGKWTQGYATGVKGALGVVYLGAILALLFFVYGLGVHLLTHEAR